MSLANPTMAVVFGSVTPPQGDITECTIHLGCSKEVSSFEVKLQNWNSKYSPGGTSPITVGMDGSIYLGRGANCPQTITCRVESVNCKSTPTEHYITIGGHCWGEKLFRRVVSKTYLNQKGEVIVKDLIDYYVGLGHVRNYAELVEDTNTTYTKLEYSDSPVWDILKYVAESSDKSGVIGYDFRVAPDGKFEFFPKNSKVNSVTLTEQIDQSCDYRKDISRVRNKIMIYGIADKSVPSDKDAWTEGTLTPTDGVWTAGAGEVSVGTIAERGTYSLKLYAQNNYYGSAIFTLNTGKEVNCDLYPILDFLLNMEKTYDGTVTVALYDSTGKNATKNLTIATGDWHETEIGVGSTNQDKWEYVQSGFDWTHVWRIIITCYFPGVGTGNFYVDGLYFGGRRYAATREDAASQATYGLREYSETDEELWSDNECDLRAKALLAYLKDPAEYLTLISTVIDYGTSPILAGDKVHVELPNENVDSDFRVESVEYRVKDECQTLEITLELGKEPPQLADYLYGLRTFTVNVEKLSRTKLGKKGIPQPTQSGGHGAHHIGHERGDTTGAQWEEPLDLHGGWDPITGWIAPSHIGPFSDVPAYIYFRTLNRAGLSTIHHVFCPSVDKSGIFGYQTKHWKEVHSMVFLAPDDGFYRVRHVGDAHPLSELGKDALKFGPGLDTELDTYIKRAGAGQLEIKFDLLPTADDTGNLGASGKRFAHVYVNSLHVTNWLLGNLIPQADNTYDLGNSEEGWRDLYLAGVIKIGNITVVTSGRVLQNVTADASIVTSGELAVARMPRDTAGLVLEAQGAGFYPMYVNPNGRYTPAGHDHAAGNITSGVLDEARVPNVYTGQVTFQGGIVTNSVNCTNWHLADAIFANDFRVTEAEKLGFKAGVAFLDDKGRVLMVLSRNGDLHLAGKVKRGLPKKRKGAG